MPYNPLGKIPNRNPIAPPTNLGLPFDPTEDQGPWSPEEMAARSNVEQSQQGLQQALGQQSQANAPPSGLAGVLQSPIFQAAVPTALTALSAIFPRHMAVAGPVGMAGYRTLSDQQMIQNQMRQSQASDTVAQRIKDFDKQRLQYTIGHSNLPPDKQRAIMTQVDFDPNGATKAFDAASSEQSKYTTAQDAMKNFDIKSLPAGAKAEFEPGPGQKVELGGKENQPNELALLRQAHPDWTAEQLIKGLAENRSITDQNEQQWITSHPGKSHLDYVAANSIAGAAGSRENKAIEDADKRRKAGSLLQALGNGDFPMISMARSPQILGDMAEENEARVKQGLPKIDLTARLIEQTAFQNRMNELEKGKDHDIILAARTMSPTLDNLEKRFDKIAPLLSNVPVVNDITLAALYHTTGNKDVQAFQTALAEARQRTQLFVNNGFAPSQASNAAAMEMLDKGFPPDAFHEAVAVTRLNAKDIIQSVVSTPVYGIDPNAPILQKGRIGPNAPDIASPSGGGGSKEYKSLAQLKVAHSRGEIGDEEAKAYARSHGWAK